VLAAGHPPWTAVVADLLRPGGRLFLREGHPMLWALDDTRQDDLLMVRYPYFERDEPMVFDDAGTYVQTGAARYPRWGACVALPT
jgi:hypothetical protein